MAELVDAPDLGSGFARSEGSSPFIRIMTGLIVAPDGLRENLIVVWGFVYESPAMPPAPKYWLRFAGVCSKPIGELMRKIYETLLFVTCDVYCLKSLGNSRPAFRPAYYLPGLFFDRPIFYG